MLGPSTTGRGAGATCMYFLSTTYVVSIGSASIVNPGKFATLQQSGTSAVSHGLERAHDGFACFFDLHSIIAWWRLEEGLADWRLRSQVGFLSTRN